MWNIKIRCPEESDSDEEDYRPHVALKYLDINKDHLIVREKGKVWHWHVHGTPQEKYRGAPPDTHVDAVDLARTHVFIYSYRCTH